ncbi:MAG: TetR/AcrR family transcriptional regulator [Mycobacterium sp.]
MIVDPATGRANQKRRTRTAIVDACRALIQSGDPVTMPGVAEAAHVSEATAYRYFPDIASLLSEAVVGLWPSPTEILGPVADSRDPVERVGFLADVYLTRVQAYQGAIRAMMSATITRPELGAARPRHRFAYIDEALAPLAETLAGDEAAFAQLKRDLAVVVSPEALFSLVDLCGLTPEAATDSIVRTAATLTRAALPMEPEDRRVRRRP